MLGIVGTRNAETGIASKMVVVAHGAQGSVVTGRAIGGTMEGTGQAGFWSRAFHDRFVFFTIWNVPVLVFVPKRRPTWNGITGVCLPSTAIHTVGACDAKPVGLIWIDVV